jgi:mono/diheme cytochrome c family protein
MPAPGPAFFAALLGAAIVFAPASGSAQDAERNMWSGLYSEAQAARGEATYAQACAMCHGSTLSGTGEAPGLSGPRFLSKWSGLNLGELLDRIRTTMPLDRPGALSRDAYADVLAFLLKSNGYPAGSRDLSGRPEMLADVTISDERR